MTRSLPRWGRWLLVIAAIILVLTGLVYAIFMSTAFSRLVLGQVESAVPALSFDQVRGSFAGGLRFDLTYATQGTAVALDNASLSLHPGCLLRMTVCLESLRIETATLSLISQAGPEPEPQPSTGENRELPPISLPVDIVLDSLRVGSLELRQDGEPVYRLENLRSSLSWRNGHLNLASLAATDSYCRWAAEGGMTFINRYPVDLQLGCESVAGYGFVQAQLSGDLEQLSADLKGRLKSDYTAEPAPFQAVLKLAPLEENLPAQVSLRIPENIRLTIGAQTAQVSSARLQAEGPLLSPDIDGEIVFSNPYWPGQNTLNLEAKATPEALTVESLTLLLPRGQVVASGRLAYQEALNWDGRLAWDQVELSQFDEGLSGQLSGRLASEVSLASGDLAAHVDLQELSGSWLDKPVSASGQFDWQNDRLSVRDFALQQAENRLTVAGYVSPRGRLDLAVNLDVVQLGQLIPEAWAPDASGEVEGQVELAGSVDDLIVNGSVAARGLNYGDLQLARGDLQLQWFGRRQRQGQLSLDLQQVAMAGKPMADVSLQGRGNVTGHSLELAIDGIGDFRDTSGKLACSGGFASQDLEQWQGRCGELVLNFIPPSGPQTWRLAEAVEIQARPQAPAVMVSPFCLTYSGSRLCSTDPIAYRDGQLSDVALAGRGLPTEWLKPFLPSEDMAVAGTWRFDFSGSDLLGERQVQAEVNSDDLTLRWQAAEQQPLVLKVTALDLNWALAGQQNQLRWNLETEQSGSSQGQLSIQDKQLAGRASIDQLQLGKYSRLLLPGPEDELTGLVNANLTLAGTLQEPVLSGRLSVNEGVFNTEVLPVPLRDIQLTLDVDDNRATADGTFQADGSAGDIGGNFVWTPEDWSGTLSVSSEPLVIRPEPDMTVHVAPDLQFKFTPQQITIAGQVRVPEAQIELAELPEQAVSTSPDTVIIGEEKPEPESRLQVDTDIRVSLGDKVYFEGFGLETRVTGDLRLRQQGGDRLSATGKLQLVEGRYQAYGQDLVIRNGDLVFVGDIDNPQLRLEAVRAKMEDQDVVVGLRVSGPAREPKVALFSNPDMPQQEQLSYLLTGNPPGTEVETDPQQAAAEAALSYALKSDVGTGIARRAGNALGIEDLQLTAGGTENGTQVGLSGYITPNLLIRYGVGVFDAINTLTLKYRLTKNLYLEATSGENSDVGVLWSFERN